MRFITTMAALNVQGGGHTVACSTQPVHRPAARTRFGNATLHWPPYRYTCAAIGGTRTWVFHPRFRTVVTRRRPVSHRDWYT